MSEDDKMSLSEQAYQIVLANQEAKDRAERAGRGPDVSSNKGTPVIVWGALVGLVLGSFGGSTNSPIWFLTPIIGMAMGAGFVWVASRILRLMRRLFTNLTKLV